MKVNTFYIFGLSLAALWLAAMPVRADVAIPVSADIGTVSADIVAPAKIDPALAAESIRTRTLPNVWQQQGELTAMRRILADPAKRANAVGHFAEEDFVAVNPAWRKTAKANAPENDVWRWARGRLEGGQIKTHASGKSADYMRDMFEDTKAESFFVPDDHIGPLVQKMNEQLARAETGGNQPVAEIWRHQLGRVKPLGRSYAELETAVVKSAQATVGKCALRAAGGAAVIVLAIDGTVIGYRCAKGELTPLQTQQAAAETVAKAGAVGAATYVAVVLGANPVGFTVIVVGGVVYLIADYAIDELRPSYTTTPMTVAQLDELMPPGWRREMP